MKRTDKKENVKKPFQFVKRHWYPTSELLEIIPISYATFNRFISELVKEGRDPAEMGRVVIQGVREALWDLGKFINFLETEKINNPINYDYEKTEQDQIKQALVVNFNNKQERKSSL